MKERLVLLLVSLFVGVGLANAQTKTVTGTVTGQEDGQPVIGATVMVKGAKTGAVTDIDGNFKLDVPADAKKIQVSYIGMQTVEVPIKPNVKVVLQSDSQMLDQVVVTGIQRVDKRLFTGATSKINAADAKLDGVPEVSRALEGRVAGVSVQNVSGTFGTAPKIRVRGATSIYGASKPLWVVDGVILEDVTDVSADDLSSGDPNTLISSAIAGLNPDDIESFQILKDGSATSIYGARAMSGVIVVTTKKGKAGTNRISYTGEFTMRLKPSYDDYNIMNSEDQMGIYKELEANGYLNMTDAYRADNSGVYGKMYRLINTYVPGKGFGLANTPEARNAYLREAVTRNTDWFDELFSNGISQNHAVSLSTGTDKAAYYASLSFMTDPGWSKQSEVKRYTANINALYHIKDNLSLNLIAVSSYRKQKAPGTIGQSIDVVSGEVKRDFDINPYYYAMNTSRTLDKNEFYVRNYAPFNIMHELDNNYMNLDVVDLRFQGELKWKPISTLEISALGAYKFIQTTQAHTVKDASNQALAYRAMDDGTMRDANPWLYTDPDDPNALPVTTLPKGGFYEETKNTMRSYDFRATASYNNVFNNDHIVYMMGGMEINAVDRINSWFNGVGMQYDMGQLPSYDYLYFKQSAEENSDYYSLVDTHARQAAFFATASYSYKGKYILSGTARYEGSNRLGKSRSARWLPTWNISGAWNVHEEKFFEQLKPLSHLTLKASYSLTADRGPDFVTNSRAVINSVNPYRPFASVRESALDLENLANDDLTYEKKHELNIGVDLGVFDNRINLSLDWYKRNNFDLIGQINTQGVGGVITKYANVADMKSHGVEFTLSTQNIKTKDFKWNTDLTFAHTKTKVTTLDNQTAIIDLMYGTGFTMVGYPVRGLFSMDYQGLNNQGLPTFINELGQKTISEINYQDRTPEAKKHLIYEGPTDPTFTGGFSNVFSYKNFRLNVFMTYAFGNVVRLDPVFSNEYDDLAATPKEFKNRWVAPGDENTTRVPVIADKRMNQKDSNLKRAYNAYNFSSDRIAKGDFIRMKEISVSYDFPKKWVTPMGISDLSLKLQGTNLFLLYSDDKLNGQDPEFVNVGGVAAPLAKQFTFTVRLGI